LKKEGFIPIRKKGSHIFYRHPDGTTTVPIHPSKFISRGLHRGIIKEIKMNSLENFNGIFRFRSRRWGRGKIKMVRVGL
jgi:predicted RNA binding protein YcfA (HicA-like mRNA interferase family)